MKTHIPFCEPYRPTCCLNADSSRLRGLGPALRARCARFTLRRSRQTELSYAEGPCPRHCCARAGLVQPWPPSRLPGLLCPRADRTPCSLLHRPRISDEISFLSVSKLTPGGVLVGSTLPLPPPPPQAGRGRFRVFPVTHLAGDLGFTFGHRGEMEPPVIWVHAARRPACPHPACPSGHLELIASATCVRAPQPGPPPADGSK